ncbi:hypothetical protein AAW51_2001 [Caldimonas brevitalea]|uniref:Uncharacterized protein n=2 Tax=Caldimonas brevitalea TaxID=413882 RepID=A0A0G3BH57_9BURK|nr:hypothetical protein AAW51_2001 [Caldimonas brevitalea]
MARAHAAGLGAAASSDRSEACALLHGAQQRLKGAPADEAQRPRLVKLEQVREASAACG